MGHRLRSAALYLVVLTGIWSIVGSATNPAPTVPSARQEISVVLTHGAGQPWYVYKGVSADPHPGGHALIESISLPGNVSYSLSHDQDTDAFFVNPGEIYAFRGMPAAGTWTAQYSGNRTDAPDTVQFTVRWK
jgi:hypothetical protein